MSHPDDRKVSQILAPVTPISVNPELDKIQPLTYKQIIESTPPPREYALFPCIPTQGIVFVYAATGVGKTLFTLNIAYAMASGGDFLKYKAPKARKVLYVDGEMSYVEVHSRFMNIIEQQGAIDSLYQDNFFLLTPDKCILKIPKICTPEGQEFFNKKIKELEVEILVLDNLSTLSAIDENNSEQWKFIQDWLTKLRAEGITTIVVHHAGKEKKGYRGTSRMLDCADTAISLQDVSQNESESEVTNTKRFKIEYQKNRGFCGQDAISFEVMLDSKGWTYESLEKSNTRRIIEMHVDLKMKPADIALEIGCSRQNVYKLLKKHCKT